MFIVRLSVTKISLSSLTRIKPPEPPLVVVTVTLLPVIVKDPVPAVTFTSISIEAD